MIGKVLIANRGEIAVRIIRACKELDIQTVAIYSTIDKDSLFVQLADEKYCIGPPPSSKSYLNIPAIASVATLTKCDAVHPGYGFLAENPKFAEICDQCGLKFIGPRPEILRLMGDKVESRRAMKKAGTPIVPGSKSVIHHLKGAKRIAQVIGYPVIIKASAGGGGKGMKVVYNEDELEVAFLMARSEAELSFSNPDVYIEKYLVNPKHIELQVVADEYGNVIFLGERECSIQRNHQKIIEEAPSPVIDETTRRKMGRTAAQAAKSIGYTNVGTVEFLYSEGEYFFMEMNTRLQVEHPVTEAVTGFDIVKAQIQIASGEKMTVKQKDITVHGHSIECRINAESPERNFMPSPGRITKLLIPDGPGVRFDGGIYQGFTIPPTYDSLIGKLIVHDYDRPEAIRRMRRALNELTIEGIDTNISLHKKILDNPVFIAGNYDTGFLNKEIF